jgi:[acyl-carrier-protein] S-malonyltransferase
MTNKIAFVFPGQGSQQVGMLSTLAAQHTIIKQTFVEASDAINVDVWALSQDGPETELNKTENTQPALLAASVALWRLWNEQSGTQPLYMSGHSLGEYSALVCAGSIGFADGVRLVKKRGEFMQTAVPTGVGAMAAIMGLDDEKIVKACEEAAQGQVVTPVNFNSPGQVVIAGHAEAVARASELCKQAGAKRALPLPVSVPSHCSLMKPAAEKLVEVLNAIEVKTPIIPVVQNVTAKVETNAADIRQNLLAQLYSPVLWVDCINAMVKAGVTTTVECGPGKVLCGLNKRIHSELNAVAINDPDSLSAALAI